MAHPLVGKYGNTDLAALPPAAAGAARDEIKAALNAHGADKLGNIDRIALLKIWMAAFGEPAEAPASPAPKAARPGPKRTQPRFQALRAVLRALTILRVPDVIFILFCIGMTTGVVALGAHSMHESLRIEEVKRDAEAVVAWIKENGGDKRADDGFEPAACRKSANDGWKACLEALTAEGGPFAGKTSRFDKSRAFFTAKCEMSDPATVGGVIIEKGAVPLGGSSLAYTAFDGSEPISKDMMLRVIVCGRGFHLVKVAIELPF